MAAAIQHAAGRALLVGTSPAGNFTWRAAAAAAPRLRRLLQQHYRASSPRALHTLLHRHPPAAPTSILHRRPAAASRLLHKHSLLHRPAAAGAPLSMMGSRHLSSYDKYKSLLQEEEEKMKRRKELAVALMEPSPSTGDEEAEIKSINKLSALLDITENNADIQAMQVRELRGLVEKKAKAMLLQLLSEKHEDGHGKEELAAAARQLRDALTRQRQHTSLHTLCTDVKRLQESVAASRIESDSANALAISLRTDFRRLEELVTNGRIESESANALANSVCRDLERVKKSVAAGRSESELAYGLVIFLCFASAGAVVLATAFYIFITHCLIL